MTPPFEIIVAIVGTHRLLGTYAGTESGLRAAVAAGQLVELHAVVELTGSSVPIPKRDNPSIVNPAAPPTAHIELRHFAHAHMIDGLPAPVPCMTVFVSGYYLARRLQSPLSSLLISMYQGMLKSGGEEIEILREGNDDRPET